MFGDNFGFYENFNEPYTTSRIGYLFSASVRIFAAGLGFSGFYLSPSFEHRHYNFSIQKIVPNRSTLIRNPNQYDEVYEKNTIYTIRVGSQKTFSWLALEGYFGLGIISVNKYTQNLTQNNKGLLSGELKNYKYHHLWPEIGAKIGILLY